MRFFRSVVVLALVACKPAPGSTEQGAPSATVVPPVVAPPEVSSSPVASGPAAASEAPEAPAASASEAPPPAASAPAAPEAPRVISAGCYEQAPQAFLMRGSYYPVKEHREEHRRAVRYRAERYGDIPRLTPRGLHGKGVEKHIQSVEVFGLPVDVHSKIVPALRCVEREIQRRCGGRYRPEALAGYRTKNTYHQGEITNHLFGIAIDIDPHRNPCCRCIEPWNNDPRCKKRDASPYERMSMPRCWVEVFERFGFYWLGQDRLEDTMHFEFLGDPDGIVPRPAARPASPAKTPPPG